MLPYLFLTCALCCLHALSFCLSSFLPQEVAEKEAIAAELAAAEARLMATHRGPVLLRRCHVDAYKKGGPSPSSSATQHPRTSLPALLPAPAIFPIAAAPLTAPPLLSLGSGLLHRALESLAPFTA
jgi:hypothetical protein